MRPNAIEMGKAGSAFLKIIRSSSVQHKPCKREQLKLPGIARTMLRYMIVTRRKELTIRMAMKQASVVFQSSYEDAFPTRTL